MYLGRVRVLLLILVGCNQIYGLDPTKVVDAAFFDVREDFSCPPIGVTPKFAPALTPIAARCTQYSESTEIGRASAFCGGPAFGPSYVPFELISSLSTFTMPRLAPEGDVLYVREFPATIRMYQRGAGDMFSSIGVVAYVLVPPNEEVLMGVPARGGRMLVAQHRFTAAPTALDEIVIAPDGTITSVRSHGPVPGFIVLGPPSFTPDGLRITFPGRDTAMGMNYMMYADRAALGDPFGAPRIIENIPYVFNLSPYLNENCSRIYAVSGDRLVWAQRVED